MAETPQVGRKRMWEAEMLSEWLARDFPNAAVMLNVRLGPISTAVKDDRLTPEEIRALGSVHRRWADAVVFDNGRVYIVEAAMVPSPGDISLLQTYMLLFPSTPELQHLQKFPRKGLLVWAVDDPWARQVALNAGLEVRLYKPSHFGEWLAIKREREGPRKVRATRPVLA